MKVCDAILNSYFAALKSNFHCRADESGRLSVITPYLYPDHDFIEVFVKERDGGNVTVSDLGETLRHLDTQGLDVMGTPNLRFAAERIVGGLQVSIESGAIFKKGHAEELGRILFDVLTAVKLVSSLLYRNRAYEPISFDEEVKAFVEMNGIDVKPKLRIAGSSGTVYPVSFLLHAAVGNALVQTVSPRTRGGVKNRVNATYRMWSDLSESVAPAGPKISLLNDDLLDFKAEDVKVLERVSLVHRWSERQEFINDLRRSA